MLILLYMIIFFLLISLILMLINFFFSKNYINDKEKASPFECGFDPFTMARMPFSIQFYMISIIFLIFDVELVILIPFLDSVNSTDLNWSELFMWFVMVLISGLLNEWWDGALTWLK